MRAQERLHGLDALRGFAALAVVVFHWQLWGVDPQRVAPPGGFGFPRALAEGFLAFFYRCGDSAVGLFFTLSGFVFYWLYRDAIQARSVDARRFAVDRFSRLYPLYFATLLWTWAGHNLFAWMRHGPGWDSGGNDLVGFARQALVFPLWTPTRVFAFNLPSWSLAVEALLYLVFFILARRALLGIAATLAMLVAGHLASFYSADISYGLSSFYMGGLAFLAFERITSARTERALAMVVGASWLFAIVFGSGLVPLAITPLALLDKVYAIYVLFPVTVLYLAVLEARKGPIARRLAWLGDSSYAIYLLHYPLMLATSIVLFAVGGDFQALRSPLWLAVFVAVLLVLGIACHRGFERPAQRWLRRRLASRRPEVGGARPES